MEKTVKNLKIMMRLDFELNAAKMGRGRECVGGAAKRQREMV